MGKIEPFRPHFENLQAMLARIAEDDQAVGFVGCVMKKDGTMTPIHYEATREQMAMAGAMMLHNCLED